MGYIRVNSYPAKVTDEVTDQGIVEINLAEGSLIPQKSFGIFLLVMAVLIPAISNGDATADFILLPLALGLLSTSLVIFSNGRTPSPHQMPATAIQLYNPPLRAWRKRTRMA